MRHVPVLLAETVELLAPGRGGLFVDCTLGLGGHAAALLEAAPDLCLIGIDRDPRARELAGRRLARYGRRARIVAGDFADLGDLLLDEGREKADGILADLGVSSLQLETPERGFSFRTEGPLDMRMGPGGLSAADVVNRYSEGELESIFKRYGEERQARRIARAVVRRREEKELETTTELAEVVRRVTGAGRADRRHGPGRRIDPATRVFQALRIEVNRELAGLASFLDQVAGLLECDGRLVVISYHSLEDRMVKNKLRDLARGEVDQITGRPRSETRVLELLTRKPLRPSAAELAANPRARSARLRAARRL